jgi:serine/threonine protein kinase
MARCTGTDFTLQLIDCGSVVEKDGIVSAIYIASHAYASGLRSYRQALMDGVSTGMVPPTVATTILLVIFSAILAGVDGMHAKNVIHYDLKMDNILVDFGSGRDMAMSVRDWIIPKIAIADFGESRVTEPGQVCLKNRGTECIKAPEMLSIPKHHHRSSLAITSTTEACDIWSLGCLLFEILTGQYLFSTDGDWFDFYYRVTGQDDKYPDVLSECAESQLSHPSFSPFIREILTRDPARRPRINGVIRKFQNLYSSFLLDGSNFPSGSRVELPSTIPGAVRLRRLGPRVSS